MAMQDSPARSAIDVGSVIAGTYTIEALIGRGGMGSVFLASHNRLPGKKVAIKLLHAELSDPDVLARFKREAEIASLLGHPNIVGVENFDVMPDGTPYLVLEYLVGETLAQRIRRAPMAVEPTLTIVRQIGSALAAAHGAGVVHRDLKPQNIFLVPTELAGQAVEQVKVLDFGISKMRGSQTVKTQESAMLGTPQYMAPEQATGRHSEVDERTDVFAFGAIVYEMLSGQPAFEGASIPEVVFKVVYEAPVPLDQRVPELPAPIVAAVHRALAKPRDERFPNVGAFVEALTGQPLLERRATSAPPLDTSSPSSQQRKATGRDALAQTMASGDHAESVARGSAPTVQSASQPVPALAPVAKRSRAPMFAAIAVGALAIAAGAWLTTSSSRQPPPPQQPIAQPQPQPSPSPSPQPQPPPPPQPQPQPSPQPPPVIAKHEPPKHATPAAAASAEPDDGCAEKLAGAEQALAANDDLRARQLANMALNTEHIHDDHKMQAYAILGVIACRKDNDDEHALIALNNITNAKLRRRVIDACHAAGYLQGTQ
jgi:serine/threonine-protein kinase